MAEGFPDSETGEMVLTEIYLHQHSYCHGIFDIFHIYEFWNDANTSPPIPSFSTNCTEPDNLNRALLKMNNMEMMDTTEIQRRLTDCVEEGKRLHCIAYIYIYLAYTCVRIRRTNEMANTHSIHSFAIFLHCFLFMQV